VVRGTDNFFKKNNVVNFLLNFSETASDTTIFHLMSNLLMQSLFWSVEKQKEFYKNAKFISKYKRSKKQQDQSNEPPRFQMHQVMLSVIPRLVQCCSLAKDGLRIMYFKIIRICTSV
jgi:hypothetical protein